MKQRLPSLRRGGWLTPAAPAQRFSARLRRGRTVVPLALGSVLAFVGITTVTVATQTRPYVRRGVLAAEDVGRGQSLGLAGLRPQHLSVPSIGVSAAVSAVGRTRQGGLAVPGSFDDVGWWAEGSGVGPDAPVVLAGHVDDHGGPAVFYRLRQLQIGATVVLTTTGGRPAHYVVDAVRQYSDSHFPTERVYGATRRPTLRMITCGGYNWLYRAYQDNVVAYAHLVSS